MTLGLLESLAAKQEITEVIYRYTRGVDRLDMDLVAVADLDHPPVEGFDHRMQPAMRRRAADLPCQSVHAITI